VVEQESKEQDPSALHQKYSKAIFRITTGLFVALAGIGALLLGTIGQGEPQVLRWYVLTLVVAGVGTGFGALLWLKTVQLLFYGQVLALVGLFGCLTWLVFVVLSVVFSEPPLPSPPPHHRRMTRSSLLQPPSRRLVHGQMIWGTTLPMSQKKLLMARTTPLGEFLGMANSNGFNWTIQVPWR
jgi:Zn-dependent protease with chaperone function